MKWKKYFKVQNKYIYIYRERERERERNTRDIFYKYTNSRNSRKNRWTYINNFKV